MPDFPERTERVSAPDPCGLKCNDVLLAHLRGAATDACQGEVQKGPSWPLLPLIRWRLTCDRT
jgi:hypothetical protein